MSKSELYKAYGIELEDITSQILQLSEGNFLSFLEASSKEKEILISKSYDLEDSSHDIEIGDPRTDVRASVSMQQPQDYLESKKLKVDPENLNLREICGFYNSYLTRAFSWVEGKSLVHCFYDLAYIHDLDLVAKNPYIKFLIHTTHHIMHMTIDFVSKTGTHGFRKYDDFHPSSIFFIKSEFLCKYYFNFLVEEKELDELGMELEKNFSKKLTKIKKKNYDGLDYTIADAIHSRISFLRNLYWLIKKITVKKFFIKGKITYTIRREKTTNNYPIYLLY